MNIDKELDNIFDDYYAPIMVGDSSRKGLKQGIKQLFQELIKDATRRKVYPNIVNRPAGEPASVTINRCDAYNEALDNVRQRAKELLKDL